MNLKAAISSEFSEFGALQHLYYEGPYSSYSEMSGEEKSEYTSQVKEFAEACTSLKSVNDVGVDLPNVSTRVRRAESGEIEAVEIGAGFGMKIGYDDEAFPWAPQ